MPMNPRLLRPIRAGGGFSPASITGLGLWLDATDASSYTESSGQITEWRDRSGNARHFAQTTANNRPTLFTSSGNVQTATPATIGSKQAFYYDGVNDFLAGNAATLNIRRNVPGVTLFFVTEIESFSAAGSFRGLFYATTNIGNNGLLVEDNNNGENWRIGARRLDSDSQVLRTTDSVPVLATPLIVTPIFDYANAEVKLRQNAVSSLAYAFQTAGNSSDTDATLVQIGQRQSAYWHGKIGEVLVYQRVLSADEIDTVESWLSGKWGVTL